MACPTRGGMGEPMPALIVSREDGSGIPEMAHAELVAAYRLNAASCTEMAKEFSKHTDRIVLLNMAQAWLRLADLTEKLGEALQDIPPGTGKQMPITPFQRNEAFDPETTKAMSRAFHAVCHTLGLANRDDPLNRLQVVQLAQTGVREPTELYTLAMKEFKNRLT
jgi:hypothetical protein